MCTSLFSKSKSDFTQSFVFGKEDCLLQKSGHLIQSGSRSTAKNKKLIYRKWKKLKRMILILLKKRRRKISCKRFTKLSASLLTSLARKILWISRNIPLKNSQSLMNRYTLVRTNQENQWQDHFLSIMKDYPSHKFMIIALKDNQRAKESHKI